MKPQDSITQELQELEELVFQPEIRHSPEKLTKILADEFIEFGSSGIVWTKSKIIGALQQETNTRIYLENFQTRELAPDVILATYRAIVQEDDNDETHSMRSSIWKRIDERWQMVFHQGTLILR